MTTTPPMNFAAIVQKLKAAAPFFVRHLDGNCDNNAVTNLEIVSLEDAFRNLDWKVDWVCFCTEEERLFIVDFLTTGQVS